MKYIELENLKMLRQLEIDSKKAILEDLYKVFVETSEEYIAKIKESGLAHATEAKRFFHSLKSSSANMGAYQMRDLCADAEKRLHLNSITEVDLNFYVETLEKILPLTLQELRSFIDQPEPNIRH